MIKDEKGFEDALARVNDWWNTGKSRVAEKYKNKRNIFNKLKDEVNIRRILILLGPRRVGKSVLLHQLIQDLLDSGIPRKNIIYYQLDDQTIASFTDQPIQDIIEYAISKNNGKLYVILDEIQTYKEWYKWIKTYYDRDLDVKFILSGSASLTLQTDANKYLRGRTVEFEIFPLDFKEFLFFNNMAIPEFKKTDNLSLNFAQRELVNLLDEYLLIGGFPEWFGIKNRQDAKEEWLIHLLTDVPKRAIYEDIAGYFNIRNPKIIDLVLNVISLNQSKIISYEKINEIVNLNRITLLDYIEFLKSSYLILEVPIYGNPKKQMKAMKKFLLIDQGLRNSLMKEYALKEDNKGFIVENVVGITLALNYSNVTYWREQIYEVDFVANDIPVEVKYQNAIHEQDFRGLLKFLEKHKKNYGIVITKDRYEEKTIDGKKIKFIPFWMFLLEPKI